MALGRKNHLFAGSDGGAVQRMVDGHPINRLDDLLPWNWAPKPVNP
jgi:hypothetical protein